MSLEDQASLLLIPSGYKSQKVYSIFPTNGDGDFNFSRSGVATRIAKNGLITTVDSNVPRLEYPMIDGVQKGCPSLILEPARTNVITHSENFSQWNLIGITVTSNSVISPNGSLNASKLVATSGSSNKVIAQGITANTYTASVFAKKGEFEGLFIGTGAVGAFFNLNTHTFRANYTSAPTSYKIEEYGNGWYRYSITFTISSSDNLYIGPNDNVSNTLAITGNGTNGIYTWGAQTEVGTFPTSYIPTNGESGGVTRATETANGSGDAATFSDSEGVLMVEIAALSNTNSFEDLSLSDGTNNNNIQFFLSSTNTITARVKVGGSTQYNYSYSSQDITAFSKYTIKYKANDFSLYVNGIKQNASTSGSIFPSNTLDELIINDNNVSDFIGKVKQVQYYDSALTDSELEKISSWTSFTEMAQAQQYSII